jgi:hypothetical protein
VAVNGFTRVDGQEAATADAVKLTITVAANARFGRLRRATKATPGVGDFVWMVFMISVYFQVSSTFAPSFPVTGRVAVDMGSMAFDQNSRKRENP